MTNIDLSGWDYEFRYWKNTIGFEPTALIFSHTGPEDYTKNCSHVFLMKRGDYAMVNESGCSCYEPSEASISFYPTEAEAIQAAKDSICGYVENPIP